jgi:hypothetical protein
MRAEIFLLGIIMVIIGPVLVALSFTSCLGTILSGNVFACINDVGYLVVGGSFFVAGIITATVGVFVPDPVPSTSTPTRTSATLAGPSGTDVTCRKCGNTYDSGKFFCPSCGQRPV